MRQTFLQKKNCEGQIWIIFANFHLVLTYRTDLPFVMYINTYIYVRYMHALVLCPLPSTERPMAASKGQIFSISSHFGLVLTYKRTDHPMGDIDKYDLTFVLFLQGHDCLHISACLPFSYVLRVQSVKHTDSKIMD